MNATTAAAPDDLRAPTDELLETIFYLVGDQLPLTPHNHVRLEDSNTYYFDYSLQQPVLKKTHAEIFRLSQVCPSLPSHHSFAAFLGAEVPSRSGFVAE